ncbi:MAG: HAMP domain-containing histidine kinase [Magnetococcales bacterium]|nr:HAMP domain-containing histidine kinase [Magnetococcales bacterium]
MSNRLSDDELIEELKKRFDHTKQTLFDLKVMTRKLEAVNKKLESSEQVKSNFVSHMKNEINNPLTSILGLTAQLISGIPEEMVVPVANMIHAEAFSLDFQLRNIFAAADLESGEADMQISNTDVMTVIRDVADSFKHQTDEKQLTVNIAPDAPEAPLNFKTDSPKLQLLIANLFSNALEFNRPEGSIDILAELVDNHLSVSVTDTGCGIHPEDMDKIFDRFRQGESGTTKTHKGHGLGLSITKAIVDLLEGSVTVDCSPEKGCTFTISIPETEMDIEADAFAVDGNEFFFDDDQVEAF